jgi:hypothetical protein
VKQHDSSSSKTINDCNPLHQPQQARHSCFFFSLFISWKLCCRRGPVGYSSPTFPCSISANPESATLPSGCVVHPPSLITYIPSPPRHTRYSIPKSAHCLEYHLLPSQQSIHERERKNRVHLDITDSMVALREYPLAILGNSLRFHQPALSYHTPRRTSCYSAGASRVGQRRRYRRLASLFSFLSGSLRAGPTKALRLLFPFFNLSIFPFLSISRASSLSLSLLLPVGVR